MTQMITIAVLVEAIWETAKMAWKDKKINIHQVGTILLGIALCLLTKLNMMETVGVTMPAIAGQIITGVLISRGSNYMHDLINLIGRMAGGTQTPEIEQQEETNGGNE